VRKRPDKVERSTGNVFQDLDLPNPEERLAKAMLSREIARVIDEFELTQTEAADLLGASQPDISNIVCGRLSGFAFERLSRYLNALGRDVEIRVSRKSRRARKGRLRVAVG